MKKDEGQVKAMMDRRMKVMKVKTLEKVMKHRRPRRTKCDEGWRK